MDRFPPAPRSRIGAAVSESRPGAAFDDLRSAVTLSRAHRSDCGQRQVVARLDGGPPITLVFGDEITLEVQPGAHHLRVHNTLFWKNLRFAIEPGEHLGFVLINGARWWTYGVVGFLGAAPLFLTVQQISIR